MWGTKKMCSVCALWALGAGRDKAAESKKTCVSLLSSTLPVQERKLKKLGEGRDVIVLLLGVHKTSLGVPPVTSSSEVHWGKGKPLNVTHLCSKKKSREGWLNPDGEPLKAPPGHSSSLASGRAGIKGMEGPRGGQGKGPTPRLRREGEPELPAVPSFPAPPP